MGSSYESIIVRDAADDEQAAIADVLYSAYEQYADILPGPRWEEYRTSILQSVHSVGPYARIVAVSGEQIVGSVLLFLSSDAAYGRPELGLNAPIIRLLAVAPSARGQGIATKLIGEAAARALELGAATLHLHTSDMMASAVKLYEHLGFERHYETDLLNGETLVKGYYLKLRHAAWLQAGHV
ncbi:GNAT family N-acetyltransferase [Paenibacillus sp. GCM10023252]|uniref:GNAT family N-acetyltransferase n=1 Tax=Paenibacillus sp. GCM10023252 TaxID=3252649 RepID=UPI003608514B